MRFLLLTLLCILTAQSAHADYSTHFIRYKAEPDFSRIVISWEEVRGHRGVDHMHANPETYATQGDYLTRGQSSGSKVITKTEEMDGHEVKTVITIPIPVVTVVAAPVRGMTSKYFLMANCSSTPRWAMTTATASPSLK